MYVIEATVNINWIGDGIGNFPQKQAQTLQVAVSNGQTLAGFVSPMILVPGGDAPSTGNISTACTTLGTTVATLLNANIAQIQGFATGGS